MADELDKLLEGFVALRFEGDEDDLEGFGDDEDVELGVVPFLPAAARRCSGGLLENGKSWQKKHLVANLSCR